MDSNDKKITENSENVPSSSIKINKSNHSSISAVPNSTTLATPTSPPNFVSIDQLSDAANLLYNMNLVHEITVDSNFKFEMFTPPDDSLAKKVKETMHKAFWDMLKSSLEADPVDYTQAFRLLEEARESLLGLLTNTPNNRYLRAHIEAKLDLDQAKTQLAESGLLDLEEYGRIVIDLMAKMCAPARDDEVAELRTLTNPMEVFKKAFYVLDLMRMDMANYTISKMRSSIRQQAVQYEKENFAKLLDTQRQAGFDGLQATKIWLRLAYDRLVQKLSKETGTEPENRSNIPVPNLILAEAYIMLLETERVFIFPETLMMDKDRMERLANRLTVLVCLASLVLFTCTLITQHFTLTLNSEMETGNQWQTLKNCIKNHCRNIISLHMEEGFKLGKGADLSHLSVLNESVHTQIMKDIQKWLADYSSDLNSIQKDSTHDSNIAKISKELSSHVSQILEFKHPVYKTLFGKAHDFLRLTLQSNVPSSIQVPPGFGLFQEKLHDSATPSHMQTGLRATMQVVREPHIGCINYDAIKTQLQPFELDSLANIATTILPITTHNKFVHGNHYADIIQTFYNLSQQQKELREGN